MTAPSPSSPSTSPEPALTNPLAPYEARLAEAIADARAAPLSARRVLLAAVLIDDLAERAFRALHAAGDPRLAGAADLPAFRSRLAAEAPALGLVFSLCGMGPEAPRLVTHAVEVPLADYPRLTTADFMVSLYNGHTVQRVLFIGPGGETDAHAALAEAIAGLASYLR